MWEYPAQTPTGRQAGLVEAMDIENGLITYHRVYRGWVGVRSLLRSRHDRRGRAGRTHGLLDPIRASLSG